MRLIANRRWQKKSKSVLDNTGTADNDILYTEYNRQIYRIESIGHSNMCKYTAIVHDFPFRVQIRVERGGVELMVTRLADGIHREDPKVGKGKGRNRIERGR